MPMIQLHFNEWPHKGPIAKQNHGYVVPDNIRVACGWPHKGGTAKRKRTIGQCWSTSCSNDKTFEIFISPYLAEPTRVLGVLIHEVVHATVGLDKGHKEAFGLCAGAVGLTKPWTATGEGPELVEELKLWLLQLGPYPHSALDAHMIDKAKDGTRMLLLECEACGCKIRTTQKWLDDYGFEWPCPCENGKLTHEP